MNNLIANVVIRRLNNVCNRYFSTTTIRVRRLPTGGELRARIHHRREAIEHRENYAIDRDSEQMLEFESIAAERYYM